jgi:hypothetical protein
MAPAIAISVGLSLGLWLFSGSSPTILACKAVSQSDAAALLNGNVASYVRGDECDYYPTAPGARGILTVEVTPVGRGREFTATLWADYHSGRYAGWRTEVVNGARSLWMPYPADLRGGSLLTDQGKYMVLVDADSFDTYAVANGAMVRALRYLDNAA